MTFRICRHIKTNGIQCQAPALRDGKFCYFHTELRRRHQPLAAQTDTSTLRPVYDREGQFEGMEPLGQPSGGIELGLLEDSRSVQVAISTVVNALATNRLEVRRATALLYGLQLAASNCRSLLKDESGNPEKMLREITGDPGGDPIANPGRNNKQTWVYPDDPKELYQDEEEEWNKDVPAGGEGAATHADEDGEAAPKADANGAGDSAEQAGPHREVRSKLNGRRGVLKDEDEFPYALYDDDDCDDDYDEEDDPEEDADEGDDYESDEDNESDDDSDEEQHAAHDDAEDTSDGDYQDDLDDGEVERIFSEFRAKARAALHLQVGRPARNAGINGVL